METPVDVLVGKIDDIKCEIEKWEDLANYNQKEVDEAKGKVTVLKEDLAVFEKALAAVEGVQA